ncbi:uncharacterized protein LOC132714192 [Ruditapes philippinarum]|uniref:uncharacterized protein LOC132714192 n=1 Tax=Ruditapes philippinarum TaxID=129788 RepID=UPI00295C3560|nr:uncharacterized protein LOC132714192 [Ruditapes philippinarum]
MSKQSDTEVNSTNGSLREESIIDVEENVTSADQREDSDNEDINKSGSSFIRYFIIVSLFVLLATGGITLYFTVFMTRELLPSIDEDTTFSVQENVPGQASVKGIYLFPYILRDCLLAIWTYYNRKCYVYSSTPVHSSDAKEYCADLDALPLVNDSKEAKNVQEFMNTQINRYIGCCIAELEMFAHHFGFLEDPFEDGQDEHTDHTPQFLNAKTTVKNLADDKSSTDGVTQPALKSGWPFFINPDIEEHEMHSLPQTTKSTNTKMVSISNSLPTPTSSFGFWLGAGHQHNHGTETEAVDENSTPNHHQPTVHSNAELEDGGLEQDSDKTQTTKSQDNQGASGEMKAIRNESVFLYCRSLVYIFHAWHDVGCNRSFIQICERNPSPEIGLNTDILPILG